MKFGKVVFAAFSVGVLIMAACGGGEPTATPQATDTPRPTATAQPTGTSPPLSTTAPTPTATRTTPPTATPVQATPTPTGTAVVRPRVGGNFRTYQSRNYEGLDFHALQNSATWTAGAPLFNWLVAYDQLRGLLVPDIAERWELSTDGKSVTFFLNKSAAWHDGKPVTADDILYNFDRIGGKLDLKSPVNKPTLETVQSVRAVDAYTVQAGLSRTSASFLTTLGVLGNVMMPKHIPFPSLNDAHVGSGPFKWAAYAADVKISVKKNEKYWKKDEFGTPLPYLDSIDFFIIADISAARAAYRTGQLDSTFPFGDFPFNGVRPQLLKEVPGTRFIEFSAARGITFNNREPFNDIRIRQTINLALDRQEAARVWAPGESEPMILYAPPGSTWGLSKQEIAKLPGFNPDTKAQDIAKAKQLFQVFLKDHNLSLDTFTPTIVSRQIYLSFAQIAQDQIKRNLGLEIKIRAVDNPTAQVIDSSRNFDMILRTPSAPMDEPSQYLTGWGTDNFLNFGGFSDPSVDTALFEIDNVLDRAKRVQLSKDLEKKLNDLSFSVIIIGDPAGIAARPEVQNFNRLNNQDNLSGQFERVWLSK